MNCADIQPFAAAQSELLGEWNALPMVAFGTMKRLSAFKMYCRAKDVPYEIANQVSDSLKQYELDYKHADEDEKDSVNVYDYVPAQYHQHVAQAESFMGIVDSISPHPCAHLLSNNDIRREVGIIRLSSTGKKKPVYAAFIDGQTADRFGYLKNDLLTVTVVKQIADAYAAAHIPQPTVPELLRLIKDDKPTWDIYAKGLVMGLNQVEREKSCEKVMKYRPRNISEMSAFAAAIRPAFQSMLNVFLNRQHFSYHIPALDQLLRTKELPESFILYQEQMMSVLQYGGFTAPESYSAIKAIAKKHPEKVLPLKERFITGFSQKLMDGEGVTQQVAAETSEKVWTIMSDACSYGFNSCLVGSTKLYRALNGKNDYSPTIAEMYRIRNDKQYAIETGHRNLRSKYVSYGYGKALSLCDDNRIHENTIIDIRYQGKRPVYRMETASGKAVVCTDNHKFPVGSYDNLVMLKDLSVGDKLYIKGTYEPLPNKRRFTKEYLPNIPHKGEQGFQNRPDGDSVVFYRERNIRVVKQMPCEHCNIAYTQDGHFELHHIDGDSTNNLPSNYVWLCNSCHKKAHYALGRTKRYCKGILASTDEIISIEPAGEEDVYDVEMQAPYHNFVIDNGLVVGNSHATAVALDSLYSAYCKAHYPYEFYAALLHIYSERGDKDRIAKTKAEMLRGFGIRMVPCRFRQDNRSYFIDRENKTISDALMSCKHVTLRAAEALYQRRNNQYDTFTDLLWDLSNCAAINSAVITILIKSHYFDEFGSPLKLLAVQDAFMNGESRVYKTLITKTIEKRLDALRQMEATFPEDDLTPAERIAFEIEHYDTVITTRPEWKGLYAVTEVDTKYSPKVYLINLASGTTGMMKVLKSTYGAAPFEKGNTLRIISWEKQQAYGYENGQRVLRPGVYDLWIRKYEVQK